MGRCAYGGDGVTGREREHDGLNDLAMTLSWRLAVTMLISTFAIAVGLYLLVAVAAFLGQRTLMYAPDRRYFTPAEAGLPQATELKLERGDGVTVLAWFARAQTGRPTILYFHGNGGSLSTRAERMAKYLTRGYGMLLMTYRGYGGSTGRPSEAANVADALFAYDTLRGSGVAAEDIVLYGELIGTGIAVQVAANRPVAGVVLDAPYTSIVDVAVRAYPYLPVRPFLLDRYETLRHLPRVVAPVLVVHGTRDEVIPIEMGRRVHDAVPGPKALSEFPDAGHSDHHLFGSTEVIQAWIDQLSRKADPPKGP